MLDVCHAQVIAGLEWWYREYAKEQTAEDKGRYESADDEARLRKWGLWQDKGRKVCVPFSFGPHLPSAVNASARAALIESGSGTGSAVDLCQIGHIMYCVRSDAIVILDVFAKTTTKTPKSVLKACSKRLRRYQQT